ncbi:MAG: SMC-Scp complex subunit ScpB, partial [Lachnospiraceae bacterium]|nr:SMC-Scp complex subunit ScpB [Lachnospiraceae bacterium]
REQESVVEAVLFTMGQSVEIRQLAAALESTEKEAAAAAERLRERYDEEDRGMQILRLEDSYQMSTRTKFYSNLIKVAATPKKQVLTDVVMETLAIIAYKQPVTKADIEKIRGVKSDHAVNRLIEYNLVYEAGRMDAPGRPALFATTEEFLRRFGVSSTVELPEMNLEQREEIKSEVEEELNLKLNGDGLPMSDEELAALAEVEAEAAFEEDPEADKNRDFVTEENSETDYTKEEQDLKIKQEEERHEMQ